MTRKLAVAALVAAALTAQGAFLYAVVAAPLSSAVGTLAARARPTYSETIVVSAPRPPHAGKAPKAKA